MENKKAGSRHNKGDRAALEKLFQSVLDLGVNTTPKNVAYPNLWEDVAKSITSLYEAKVAEEHGDDTEPYHTGGKAAAMADMKSYDYGTSQVRLDPWVGLINQGWILQHAEASSIYTLESEPHITLHYGISKNNFLDIARLTSQMKPFTVTIGEVGVFERDDFDVIFLHVDSPELQELGESIRTLDDVRPSNFDPYTPHITIAYLAKGTGEKLLAIPHPSTGKTLDVSKVEVADKDGTYDCLYLGEPVKEDEISYEQLSDALRSAIINEDKEGSVVQLKPSTFVYTTDWETYYRAEYSYMAKEGIVESVTIAGSTPVKERREWVAKAPINFQALEDNYLKSAQDSTENHWVLGNHILLFGDENQKDLEGVLTHRKNKDGTKGEFFTKSVKWKSGYTDAGFLYVDFEHGLDGKTFMPQRDDILGWVDMKSAVTTEEGLFARRVLNLQNKYVSWLKKMVDGGLITLGTSSEPVQNGVRKAANGEITHWPLYRDTITVKPLEPRNVISNSLGDMPNDVADFIKSVLHISDESEEAGDEGETGVSRQLQLVEIKLKKAQLRNEF